MGADLIGYFAKGPAKLPKRAVAAAIAEADRRLQWMQKARPVVEASDDAAVMGLIHDCPWVEPVPSRRHSRDDSIDLKQLRLEIEHLLTTAGDIEGLTGQDVVKRFIECWPPRFRDTSQIVDPDCSHKLIVFAGERTWGDTPEGAGFQLLTRAGILGIGPILGVWIEAAFMTLRIPSSAWKGKKS